jgi:hypothetical protein
LRSRVVGCGVDIRFEAEEAKENKDDRLGWSSALRALKGKLV